MEKVDGIVDQIIRYQLERIGLSSAQELLEDQAKRTHSLLLAKHNMASFRLKEKQQELADLKAEIIRIIRGESKLDGDIVNELIIKAKSEIQELEAEIAEVETKISTNRTEKRSGEHELAQLKTWADIYDRCSFEEKKMIASDFVKSVYIHRDYTMEIEFNVTFEAFQKLACECDGDYAQNATVYIG